MEEVVPSEAGETVADTDEAVLWASSLEQAAANTASVLRPAMATAVRVKVFIITDPLLGSGRTGVGVLLI
jgi:hypothetical protein